MVGGPSVVKWNPLQERVAEAPDGKPPGPSYCFGGRISFTHSSPPAVPPPGLGRQCARLRPHLGCRPCAGAFIRARRLGARVCSWARASADLRGSMGPLAHREAGAQTRLVH
jgi:hypothetical protein